MRHSLGYAHGHTEVYVELIGSRAAQRVAQHPQLLVLAAEMLQRATMSLTDAELTIEQDMGRPIGYSHVVATKDSDHIFYALVRQDTIYTRFIKNGKPSATSYLTAVLKRGQADGYELADIWIGQLAPPRPGEPDETNQSRPYWLQHALVLDRQALQMQTITKLCPY